MERVRGRLPLLLAGVLLLAGAGMVVVLARSTGRPATQGTPPSGGQPVVAEYLLRGEGRPAVAVRLEVAASPAARDRGLMGRTRVPAGTGMVFLFPADTTAAFWMKDTLVPLSIAFVAGDGRVVAVREMTPCTADPCPVYGPDRSYRYAVELAAGAFTAARVREGSQVVPRNPERLPVVT
jgi:uncharacterized membrane protein (UPF0127 family)